MFNSVNSYSSMATRKGVGGLVSGMDTDSLVKQLTGTTRARITSQLQKKQLALWKQEAYREISSEMISFKDKYFSFAGSNKNNILSSNFFNASSIKCDSPYVKLSGNTDSVKNMVIKDIKSLASTAKLTTTKELSSQKIETGKIEEAWDKSLVNSQGFSIKVGDKTHIVTVSDDFMFTTADKIDDIVKNLNANIQKNTDLKDKIEFAVDGDKVKLISKDSTEIKITGSSKDLCEALGFKYGEELTSSTSIIGENAADATKLFKATTLAEELSGSTLTLTLNGISKNIEFKASDVDSYDTVDELVTYLQGQIKTAFGDGKINVVKSATGGLEFTTIDKTSTLYISDSSNKDVLGKVGALRVNAGTGNRINWSASIKDISNQFNGAITTNASGNYEMNINGVALEFTGDDTLYDVLNKINNSEADVKVTYSTTNDVLTVTAKESGANGKVNILETSNGSNFAAVLFGTADKKTISNGSDSEVVVNINGADATIKRTTNSFALDGVNIELLGKADGATEENITATVENNTDELVQKMKTFIEDYNKIVKMANDKVTEKKDRKYRYDPLTDEQKEEMSDKEVERWEEKAKQGILQSDMYLTKILTSMRSAVMGVVDGSNDSLSKIGISTSQNWLENGQLHFDEEKFRKALAEDPERISDLFTKDANVEVDGKVDTSKSGVAQRLNSTLQMAAGTFGGDGILIQIAGVKGDSSAGQDKISLNIKQIDSRLTELKTRLKTEEDRYWRQFSAMEKYLSNMNQQSSWLTQQLGQ